MRGSEEPQATVSIPGSTERMRWAASLARATYLPAGTCPSCHQPSISLPRHQRPTP